MVPPTPVPPSAKAPPPSRARMRRIRQNSDDGNNDMDGDGCADDSNSCLDVQSSTHVLVTPSLASMRSQRASKTAALAKMAAKSTAFQSLDSDDDLDKQSVLTDEDS